MNLAHMLGDTKKLYRHVGVLRVLFGLKFRQLTLDAVH